MQAQQQDVHPVQAGPSPHGHDRHLPSTPGVLLTPEGW